MNLQEKSVAFLRKRRISLLKKLTSFDPRILRGSLIERYLRCGKPGCKCTQGPGHGPKYYLSVSYPNQRPQQDYVPQQLHNRVVQSLANYQKLKTLLENICDINRELLRRREEL
jgi:hypothetical protein